MTERIHNFINGKLYRGDSRGSSEVYNPATGQAIASVDLAGTKEVDVAVNAAMEAKQSWQNYSVLKRSRILRRFLELLDSHSDELARVVTREHGKTISDAKGELARGMEIVEFAIGAPQLLKGEYSNQVATGVDSYSMRQPLGVCCGITPFNFPLMVPLWMAPISLACGNTFILKPSERDPSPSIYLAELLTEAGLPDGVFNVIQGGHDAVNALLQHADIDAVSFVGSTNIAKYIYEQSAKYGKRVQALGGAKNHLVLCPDADLDKACEGIIGAAFGSAGQRCMAISVVVAIGDDVADAIVVKLKDKVSKLKVGSGYEPDTDMGPVITRQQQQRISEMIANGVEQGASLEVDGRGVANLLEGFFIGPTIFDKVDTSMQIYQEEIFGPVLCIIRVKSLEEATNLISNHKYGNGVTIYTQNGNAAREFTSRINVGMVGVNVPIPVPLAFHSFGGWKQSAFGDMAMHGPEGIRFNTRLKTVTQRWTEPTQDYMQFQLRD